METRWLTRFVVRRITLHPRQVYSPFLRVVGFKKCLSSHLNDLIIMLIIFLNKTIFGVRVFHKYCEQGSLAIAKTTARCAQYMGSLKSFESPRKRPRLLFPKFVKGFCSDGPCEYNCQI